ncbi:MAG: glycosyltransferase [Planctomycetota bacterium]
MGTRSGEQYLRAIAPALASVHRATGARLTIIGDPAAPIPVELRAFTDRRPWSLDVAHTTLADFDVGIMPLLDTPYERGKCAYKLLEYGASDLPSVASPVGANRPIIQAASALGPALSEWQDALIEMLAATDSRREAWGRRLGDTVRADYAFSTWLPTWHAAVFGCAAPSPPVRS